MLDTVQQFIGFGGYPRKIGLKLKDRLNEYGFKLLEGTKRQALSTGHVLWSLPVQSRASDLGEFLESVDRFCNETVLFGKVERANLEALAKSQVYESEFNSPAGVMKELSEGLTRHLGARGEGLAVLTSGKVGTYYVVGVRGWPVWEPGQQWVIWVNVFEKAFEKRG